jgi:hypothetical protein
MTQRATDPDHATELEMVDLLAGDLDGESAARVADHARTCLACSMQLDRIAVGLPDLPDANVRAAASVSVAGSVLAAVAGADRPRSGARPGELWRARARDSDVVMMVWVRARTPKATVVVPASLDTDYADEHTVIVPAEASPLGLSLALHTAVESAIDPGTLVDRLGLVDAMADVDAARAAFAAGVRPDSVTVGPSIASPLDERVEYREALARQMADLAPAGVLPDEADSAREDWWLLPEMSASGALLATIQAAVGAAHPNARIVPRSVTGATAEYLRPVALVAELDAFVLVAIIDRDLGGSELLAAARDLLGADQLLDAVCFVEPDRPYMAVVVDRRDVVDAIETPSGAMQPPRRSRPAAIVGDALTKFLDATISPFGRLAGTVVDGCVLDPHDVAVDVSAEAVRAVGASARGYKVQGKRPGYERVVRHRDAIARLVEAALTSPDVDVSEILEGDG